VGDEMAGIESPELRESYELCARVSGDRLGPVWTDGLADDGDPADLLAQWCQATLAEVRAARSSAILATASEPVTPSLAGDAEPRCLKTRTAHRDRLGRAWRPAPQMRYRLQRHRTDAEQPG
jgi:hypothetical protein